MAQCDTYKENMVKIISLCNASNSEVYIKK